MLACARIGAIHSVVFGGFSPDALAGRVDDCESNVVITADEGLRGGRPVPLKRIRTPPPNCVTRFKQSLWSNGLVATSIGSTVVTFGITKQWQTLRPIARPSR